MNSLGALALVSPRTRRRFALLWSALFILSILLQYAAFAMAPAALAVHNDGLFELDKNAVTSSSHDWDQVYNDVKNHTSTAGADQVVFKTDAIDSSSNEHLFTGGGSKDGEDISSWKWTSGAGVQDKNDIEDAYAASYSDQAGHSVIYFGQDRYAQSGDAFVGFWFLKNAVSEKAGGTFNGVHANGDVLVQVNFTNGGVISTFLVSKWENGGLVNVDNGVDCSLGSTPANDPVCGVVNAAEITSPWPFTPKSGTDGKIPAGGFFEAGIDLTHFGLDQGCFSTFVAETRSSQSLTSTLSDYASGSFSFCVPPDISTQVEQDGQSLGSLGSIDQGGSVQDTATLTGSKGTVEGSVDFFVCGPASSAPDCSTGGTDLGSKPLSGGKATSASFSPAAAGTYCFRAEYTPPATGSHYLAASHTNTTTECFRVISPDVTVTKVARDPVVFVGQTATFDITVTNIGTGVAHDVVLTDPLPAGPDWQTTSTGCSIASGTLTCTIGDLDPKATFSATVSANTDTSAPNTQDCHVLDNTATVSASNEPAGALGNNQSSASVTVTCVSSLTIQKSVAGNTGGTDPDLHVPAAKIGDTLTYTLAYSGAGPLHHVVITDDLPAGLAFIQGSACKVASDPLPCDTTNPDVQFVGIVGGLLTWQADSLPDPATGSVTFKVRVLSTAPDQVQPIVNTATIDSDETEPDSDIAAVAVLAPPEALTPPPTNTLSPTAVGNPGLALMLILIAVAGVIVAVALVTPAPGTGRRGDRRR